MADSADTTNPSPDPEPTRMANLVLSQPFVDRLAPQQVRAYVDAIVATAADSHDRDLKAVTEAFRRRVDAAGVPIPEESYQRIAEQLIRADGHVSVSLDDGTVLFGPPEAAPDEAEPDVRGTDDPEHPDRPFYS